MNTLTLSPVARTNDGKDGFWHTLFGVDMTSESILWLLSSTICLPPAYKAISDAWKIPWEGFDEKKDDRTYQEWMKELTDYIDVVKNLKPAGQNVEDFYHAELIKNFETCWNAAADLLKLTRQNKQTSATRKVFDYMSILKQIFITMKGWQS